MLNVTLSSKEYKRIFAKISINNSTKCWNWRGSLDQQGYGMVWYKERCERIHRVLYAYFVEPIPRGTKKREFAQIHHTCNNTTCCNPSHLKLVTQKENVLNGNSITSKNAKKTHCKHGHKFPEPEKREKRRNCKTCDNIRHKKRIQGPQREYWLEKQRQATRRYNAKHK